MAQHNKNPADTAIGPDHVDKGTKNDDLTRRFREKDRDDATRGRSTSGDTVEEKDQERGGSRDDQINDDSEVSRKR